MPASVDLVGCSEHWTRDRLCGLLLLLGSPIPETSRDHARPAAPAPSVERRPWTLAVAAAVHAVIPLASELPERVVRLLRSTVPQIDGSEHERLVERVHSDTRWSFDFTALVCLSTLIASLGLVRNTGSVVIGAMLVAPLMTPLVAIGLALARGDLTLIRSASRSALLGFSLVFGIGLLLGAFLPGLVATAEMLSRGSPNVLDLVVAFITGMAAAYASARPSLPTVLPGAAIAAAVVPPIATCGISLAIGRPLVAVGAAILFLANVVAIVLGSAVCLRAVGVCRSYRYRGADPWVGRVILGLILVATVLTIPLSYMLYASLPSGEVPEQVVEAIEERIRQSPGAERLLVERTNRDTPVELKVVIASPSPPPRDLAGDLATIAGEHYQTDVRIRVVTELISQADSRELPS